MSILADIVKILYDALVIKEAKGHIFIRYKILIFFCI